MIRDRTIVPLLALGVLAMLICPMGAIAQTSQPDRTVAAATSQPDNDVVPPAVSGAGPTGPAAPRSGEVTPPEPKTAADKPAPAPELTADEMMRDLLKGRGDASVGAKGSTPDSDRIIDDLGVKKRYQGVEPSRPEVAGKVVAVDSKTEARRLLPEGYVIRSQMGHVRRDRGRFMFVFESDKDGGAPPLALLPNSVLQNLLRESNNGDSTARFRITGTVTLYQQTNYLLLQMVVAEQNLDRF
ncbi:MAG: hypothetical protein PHU85_12770 [Phycisphaerae bacterium]|nr:hypothetical protein [Phycisphaerae bacterium]